MASTEEVIREGFICPVCMKTLDRQEGLLEHVRTEHPDNEDDDDMIGQVKGWIGRMGKKLKAKGEEMTATAMGTTENMVSPRRGSIHTNFAIYEDPNCFQENGKCVSLTEEFLNLRSQGVNRAQREQNRLLMRLEKLLQVVDDEDDGKSGVSGTRFNLSNAAVKRKAQQKALVPWVRDKDVPLCPICASEFNILTRRKHHCRLCGFIMCADCSNFLSESAARQIVKPVEESGEDHAKELTLSATFLSRSNSETSIASLPTSLNSYMPWSSNSSKNSGTSADSENKALDRTLRVCAWCRQVLESHMRKREEQMTTPIIVQLYDQLQDALQTVKDEIGNYEVLLETVKRGESQDALATLNSARIRLLRLANFADDCSRQIMNLPTPTDASIATAAEQGIILPKTGLAKLQTNIRAMVANTLTHSSALHLLRQPLPTQEEYDRRVKEHRRAQQRLREEEAIRGHVTNGSVIGWTPAPPGVAAPELHDDPLEQQIANIREYARLARDAGKYEELLILEDNLKMLEEERRAQLRSKR